MAQPRIHVTAMAGNIVEPVGDDHTMGRTAEIMVESLQRRLSIESALTAKIDSFVRTLNCFYETAAVPLPERVILRKEGFYE